MKINDLISLAWRNLMRRKSRTVLTILSVVIGIFSIILMLSFGFGIQKQQETLISSLGGLTAIQVNPTQYIDPNSNDRIPTTGVITDKTIEELKNNPKIKNVFALSNVSASLKTNKKNIEIWSNMSTLNIEDLRKADIKLEDGSELPNLNENEFFVTSDFYAYKLEKSGKDNEYQPDYEFDISNEKIYFMIGYKPEGGNIFDTENNKKTYEEIKAKFKGKIAKNDYIRANTIIVNEKTANKIAEINRKLFDEGEINNKARPKNKIKLYEDASVFVNDMDDVSEVIAEIELMGLSAHSDQDYINAERERTRTIQLVLGGIGSIALIVAAIGISNTMLMSIHERTKEIGVMKVIGAQLIDIRKMFLIEAMLIGIIGGIIGIILSFGASEIANNIMRNSIADVQNIPMETQAGVWIGISYIPIWLPFIAVIFSAIVGLVAGYLPAHRATKLSAIEAIRTN